MELKEIIAAVEKALDARFNEESIKTVVSEELKRLLEPIRKNQLIIGELPDDQMRPPKVTFSQYLGDVVRHASGGNHPTFGTGLKWMKPDQMIRANSGISPEMLQHVAKDLYAGLAGSGGVLVPTEESRELVNVATENYSVIPGLCRQVPMRTNQIVFPTLTGGLTAYWIPEAGATSTLGLAVDGTRQALGEKIRSQPTLANLTLSAFVLAVVVVVSNQLLDDSDPQVDAILRGLFAETLADAWDSASLNGTGAALDPITGLNSLCVTNALAAGAVFDFDDLLDLIFTPLHQDSKSQVQIIGNTYSELKLMKVKDDDKQYVYKAPVSEAAMPTVWGRPFYRDGNIPINLGAGGNATRLFAGDFRKHGYAGNRMGMVIRTNPYGEPYFSYNQTAFLAEVRVGFGVDHEKYFSKMEGVPTA